MSSNNGSRSNGSQTTYAVPGAGYAGGGSVVGHFVGFGAFAVAVVVAATAPSVVAGAVVVAAMAYVVARVVRGRARRRTGPPDGADEAGTGTRVTHAD